VSRRVHGSLVWVALMQGIGYAAILVWNVLAARICPIDLYGVVSFAVGLVLAVQLIIEFGHHRALVRFLGGVAPEDRLAFGWQLRRAALRIPLAVGLSLVVAALIAVLVASDAVWGGVPVLHWMLLVPAGLGAALMSIHAGAAVADGRPVLSSLLNLTFMPVIFCIELVLLARLGAIGSGTLLGAVAVPYVAGGIYSAWRLGRRGSGMSVERHHSLPTNFEFRAFALRAMAVTVVSLGLAYADRAILGTLASFSAVGLYSLPARMARMLNLPVYILNPLVGAAYAAVHSTGRSDSALAVFRESSRMITAVVLPIGLIVILHATPILIWIGGDTFAEAGTSLTILALGVIAMTLSGNAGLLLQMAGHEDSELRCTVVGLIANIALAILLVRPLGIVGVALGTAIGLSVVAFLRLAVCRRHWSFRIADLVPRRQVFGILVFLGVELFVGLFPLAWPVRAVCAFAAFVLCSAPWRTFGDLGSALANAERGQRAEAPQGRRND
jgi:O-antigen/teichoic acid export membrane protein